MHLIVGLGNPGSQYEKNRHNVGFMVVDILIDRLSPQPISKKSFKGQLFKSGEILLLKPTTFMNRSGESVQAVASFYKIPLENIIVIHDDLDLALGAIRIKKGGGHGGHNGLRSIDASLGREYLRVRVGIGRPSSKEEVVGYVLSDFSPKELDCIQDTLQKAADAALALVTEPLEKVRSLYSQKAPSCD